MTIEKKLERVMEIGRRLECLDMAYMFFTDSYLEANPEKIPKATGEALLLWIEFNEIVASIRAGQRPSYKPQKHRMVNLGRCISPRHSPMESGMVETTTKIRGIYYDIVGCDSCVEDFIRKKGGRDLERKTA